jgi:hypothetical protein
MGGLGISQASKIALSAYTGSIIDTLQLQASILGADRLDIDEHAETKLRLWNQKNEENLSLAALSNKSQHTLTSYVHKKTFADLENSGDVRFKAIVKACAMDGSALWTNTLPVGECRFEPHEFTFALKYRLGLPVLQREETCLGCDGKADVHGFHISTCPNQHPARHNAIRDLLRSEAKRALLDPYPREPVGLLAHVGRPNDRPGDVVIRKFIDGRDTCIDVSIVCSFTEIQNAAGKTGCNAARAEKEKRKKYETALVNKGLAFTPFVMESMGGFGSSCSLVLQLIGRSLSEVDHVSTGVAVVRLKQQIQCKWMRSLGSSLSAQASNSFV